MLSINKEELRDLLGSCACPQEPPEEAPTGLMSLCAATLPSCIEDNPGVIPLPDPLDPRVYQVITQ